MNQYLAIMLKTPVIKGIVLGLVVHATLLLLATRLLDVDVNHPFPVGFLLVPALYGGSVFLAWLWRQSDAVFLRIGSDTIFAIDGLLFVAVMVLGIAQSF
jgi:hypothetical protein